ncbi:hypothetical protein ES703_109881 [subsurface metagenome]
MVSLKSTSAPPPSAHFLVRVSSVAKRRSSTKTSASVRTFKSVLLPAFVYPMRQILNSPPLPSISRILRLSISTSLRLSSVIRLLTNRRSISNCCSPGPLVPMPPTAPAAVPPPAPATLSRCDHILVNRGYVYSSWANSTCSLACLVFALVANMSKINSLRSSTLTSITSSSSRIWPGDRSLSNITTSALNRLTLPASWMALPLPI